jgi:serine/threonine protein kinase
MLHETRLYCIMAGRYELLRPLARGGMAELYLARRRAGGVEKLLVIKRIRAERANDARFLELFVREARLSMSLAHQNIVPVFDFGRIGDQVFLAMERVEGKDLGATLARPGVKPLAAVVAAFVAAECCRALGYAHERHGAVHRDVTPRNVLVSWSGEVKLTDFGIATVTGDQTSRLVGTPAYMAPEQARGEPIDARADLYALGLVLRELVTGVRARCGDDSAALLAAARTNELVPWPDEVPPALVAIVERAAATMPQDRFPSARAMLDALDEYIVAARAARVTEAPDRQLADWIERAWASARDEESSDGIAVTGDIVSMFDDTGTATERSLAATLDEPRPVHGRSRAWPVVTAIVLLIVGGFALRRATCNAASPSHTPPVTLDAREVDAALDTPPIDSPPVIDAMHADRPHIDALVVPPRPVRDALPRDAQVQSDVPALVRKVRINARPWAYFTIDGASTRHQTISTVELVPGRHQLHFSNPELGVEREVTIEVPADHDIDHVEDLRR